MDIRNCMRMNFFLFHVVHRIKLQKNPFHKQTASVTAHIVALVLLALARLNQFLQKFYLLLL